MYRLPALMPARTTDTRSLGHWLNNATEVFTRFEKLTRGEPNRSLKCCLPKQAMFHTEV